MPPVPTLTAREVEAILYRAGFVLARQTGHRVWQKGDRKAPVPRHRGDLPKGTLRSIIELTGMSVADFLGHR
jgi:predicted RNA binding protein YcfA (HicA-like mRNA interferase family)